MEFEAILAAMPPFARAIYYIGGVTFATLVAAIPMGFVFWLEGRFD